MSFTPFPHHYHATAIADADGADEVQSPGLASLTVGPPAEFGGSGEDWSPETLMAAAVADCFVLTFKAVAKASKFPWTALTCEATGTLDRVDRVTQFTAFDVKAALSVPEGTDRGKAHKLLEKAEHVCLITNSLRSEIRLETTVTVETA